MSDASQILRDILDLKQLDELTYEGISYYPGWPRIYGGQVIAQAIKAATLTAEGRDCHSMHAYFMRPGDPEHSVIYKVDPVRDGKSFHTRVVYAIQNKEVIFSMGASFHKSEKGLDHQDELGDTPLPDDLPTTQDLIAAHGEGLPKQVVQYFSKDRPFELRLPNLSRYKNPKSKSVAKQELWLRAVSPLSDETAMHQAALGYISDLTLLDTALIAHGKLIFDPKLMLASLDHAIWFHRPFKVDEWLLYRQTSPNSFGARALCFGQFFDLNGKLVASTAQEGLVRERTK